MYEDLLLMLRGVREGVNGGYYVGAQGQMVILFVQGWLTPSCP